MESPLYLHNVHYTITWTMWLSHSLGYCTACTCLRVQLFTVVMCENPLNMSMINMCLAKLQTYVVFRVTDRVWSNMFR